MERGKRVVVVLGPEMYHRLERLAEQADRDAFEHARYLLKRAIDGELNSLNSQEALATDAHK